ncbi:ABATE domain-containing protein [Streptomyces sp. H10-C2]|uniref:CGNR zinc finger domain-containing protein n=1 Tax=unclassified Streptomyces TaxID=2593676 RepID=UPI0024BA46EA|nr:MULTISPECIES: ABATE domain-containing protein [unclassified Streptomyces]MDJ0343377.1 ABATE domain-containing protein [Streptomyces sp. PH10-H1]MDJ0371812.1 ABATE domain-containing protein [Streptomyces sp. H10-C2]
MDTMDRQPGAPLLGEPLPVELMNTIWADRDGVHDGLNNADDLARWLRAVGPRFTPALALDAVIDVSGSSALLPLVDQYRQLRDALRRLAAVTTEDPRPAAASAAPDLGTAVGTVNRACAYAPEWSQMVWPEGGAPSLAAGPSDAHAAATALSRIAEQAVHLFTGPDRVELRACHAPGCVLYFLRAHPRREWCSATCGNRARVARHYQRHHADPSAPNGAR